MRSLLRRMLGIQSTRAIRGAITVTDDSSDAISKAVEELVAALVEGNRLDHDEIISAIFTVTTDLSSAFPAVSARAAGWERVPLLCTTEIPVPGGMPRCIRVLLHVERCWEAGCEPVHVYLRDARRLRPDLAGGGGEQSRSGTLNGVVAV